MNKKLAFLLLSLMVATFGCVSITSFQDGKTLGKGRKVMFASLNWTKSPSVDFLDDYDLEDIPVTTFPSIEFGRRFGITEKCDFFLRITTNLNLSAGGKYQLLGTRESTFAMGIGAELGTFTVFNSSELNAQVPIFTSYHPSENLALYFTPRYVYQFKLEDESFDYHYFGGNVGLLYGKYNKIGLDIGFFQVGIRDLGRLSIVTVGVGGRFFFDE